MRCLAYIFLSTIILSFSWLGVSCSCDTEERAVDVSQEMSDEEDAEAGLAFIDAYLADTLMVSRDVSMLVHDLGEPNEWDEFMTMPDHGCEKLTINYPGGTLRELFRDSNVWHYGVGDTLGIFPIFEDSLASYPLPGRLVPVRSTELYRIDRLTYSYPFLVPEARDLLDEIGRRFRLALNERGGGPYRFKVTSLLRTHQSVKNLQKVNTASVGQSSHLRGVSFDISSSNFSYDGGTPHRTQEDLKNLMAEILHGLRSEGRCFVIYEPKQSCFHVTVRPRINS